MEKVTASSTTSVYFHDGLDVVADYDEKERGHSGLRVQRTPVPTNSVRKSKNAPIFTEGNAMEREEAPKCPECGAEMHRGRLQGVMLQYWTPRPPPSLRLNRWRTFHPLVAWACKSCGLVVLRLRRDSES